MADQEARGGKEFLDRIYGLDDPGDVRRFYDSSAREYDQILLHEVGYVSPRICAQRFRAHFADKDGLIADLGCGSGLAGEELVRRGYRNLVGIDFSVEMLAVAKSKGCYQTVHRLDLNASLPVENERYAAAISVGAFGQHIQPPVLDEVLRVVATGGIICISVNELAFDQYGFRDKLRELELDERAECLSVEKGPYHVKQEIDGWVCVLRVR